MCDCSAHNGFLTAKGLEEAAQRKASLDALDNLDMFEYIDNKVSVSGSRRDEIIMIFDDGVLDEQYRRFLVGSAGAQD